jgi:hypothetical protein
MSEATQAPRSRYESIELHLPEVEKFIAGLEAGVFEAYETLGMVGRSPWLRLGSNHYCGQLWLQRHADLNFMRASHEVHA